MECNTKFIFITGGVLSSLGKGLAAAAIGALLESRGLKVTIQKLDPYINVDPGTMNPFQHGEVFVTDEIKASIRLAAKNVDVVIVEIGGTVGDIESLPFLEAIRQFKSDMGKNDTLYIHVTLVPYIKTSGEVKTKPTQHSVKELRSIGIQPDILLCRTDRFLPQELKAKIALFCNVEQDAVITAKDVACIYEVPLVFHCEGLDDKIVSLLNVWTRQPRLEQWEDVNKKIKDLKKHVTIAIVGKYVDLTESYKSLNEALFHGGVDNNTHVDLLFVDSEKITQFNVADKLKAGDGILVPGGFGPRGIPGKILAARYARENRVPFFGICLGMHVAVIEFGRNVLGLKGANSAEFDAETPHPLIYLMKVWFDDRTRTLQTRDEASQKGGTMRLGAYPCHLVEMSVAHQAYGKTEISERHRHRFEFNNTYREQMEKGGMVVSGISPSGELVEIVELKDHPWYLGCQFHPEFKSKPMAPHPLFSAFIKAAMMVSRPKEPRT